MVVKTHKRSMRSKRSSKKSKSHSGKKTMKNRKVMKGGGPKVPMSAPSPKSFLNQIRNGSSALKPTIMGTSSHSDNRSSRSKWTIGMGPYNPDADPKVFKERYKIYKTETNPNKSMSTGYNPYSLAIRNAITARKGKMTRYSNYSNFII